MLVTNSFSTTAEPPVKFESHLRNLTFGSTAFRFHGILSLTTSLEAMHAISLTIAAITDATAAS